MENAEYLILFFWECLVEIQDKVRKELGIKGVNECLEYLEERNC